MAFVNYMKIQDRIWVLIARKFAGEISASEAKELNEFIVINPALQYYLDILTILWLQKPGENGEDEKRDAENIAKEIFERNS